MDDADITGITQSSAEVLGGGQRAAEALASHLLRGGHVPRAWRQMVSLAQLPGQQAAALQRSSMALTCLPPTRRQPCIASGDWGVG